MTAFSRVAKTPLLYKDKMFVLDLSKKYRNELFTKQKHPPAIPSSTPVTDSSCIPYPLEYILAPAMQKLRTKSAEDVARERFEASKTIPKLEKVTLTEKKPLTTKVSWLDAIVSEYYWTLLSRIGLATEGKLMNTDKATTFLGAILAAIIAANVDLPLLLSFDLTEIGKVVAAAVVGIFGWLANKTKNG